MSTSHEKDGDIVQHVERILRQDPKGQTVALTDIRKELTEMLEGTRLGPLEQVIQLFGTAVGNDKAWQEPFRESEILVLAVGLLNAGSSLKKLRKQALRVIGNSVADNDLNREVITKHMDSIVELITEEDLSTITLIVLFNLCNDFDPAKAAAASLRLDTTITHSLSTHIIAPDALDCAVDLLTWTTSKLTAEQLNDATSISSFRNLLKVALNYDEDHYHEYIAILVHYLQDPAFQEAICSPQVLDDLVVLTLDFETRLSVSDSAAVFGELAITKTDDATPSEDTGILLLSQLINAVAGISGTNAFAQSFDLTTPVIERMRTKLAPPDAKPSSVAPAVEQSPSAVVACVMLGNLAMSDEVCVAMVRNWRLHVPLIHILRESTHSALLYAALGLLRHLAFPEANRSVLGDEGLIEACQRSLSNPSSDAAVLGEVAALLGKLVTNNLFNVEKVVKPSGGQSCLETLVRKSLEPPKPLPSTSMKNLSIESGKTIVSILRVLGRADDNTPLEDICHLIFRTPHIARPLARLVRQRFYADARSEGLLGLGLMAQNDEGAACVIEEFKEDEGLLDAIKEFARGEDGGGGVEGKGQAAGRDYQNAMVLLQALRNNGSGAEGAVERRIEELQEELGKMMG